MTWKAAIRSFATPPALPTFLQGRLARHLTVLAGSTVAAQALVVLASPLLTRLYTPEDFGHLAVFAALFTTASTFLSLKYDQAIPVAKDHTAANNLLALSAAIAFAQCCVLGVVIFLAAPHVPDAWLSPAIKQYLWILVPGLFFAAVYMAATYWMVRQRSFSHIATTKLSQSVGKTLVELILGLLAVKPLGLLLGHVAGQVGGAGLLLRVIWNIDRRNWTDVSVARMWGAAREHVNFPLFVMPSIVLNTVSATLPFLLIPLLFGQAQAGFFLVAQKLTMWPMTLIGQSIAQVFYSEIAAHRDDQARNLRLFRKLTWRLSWLGLAGAGVLLTAPFWTMWVLGENWEDAGWAMAALAPLLLTRLVVSPLSHAHHLQNSQAFFLLIEWLRLVLTAAVFGYCYWREIPFRATVVIYSLSISLIYVFHWLAILSILRRKTTRVPLSPDAHATPESN